MADYTWQGIPYETPPADTGDRTCPSGVCGSGPGNVGLLPSSGGGTAPMGNVNLVGQAMRRALSQSLAEERNYWQELLAQLHRPEDTYVRYIVKQIISGIGKEYATTSLGNWRKAPPEVPDWMEQYLVSPVEEAEKEIRGRFRGREPKEKEAIQPLRPLGAQEDLTADQLGLMAGYLGWQMAGAPTGAPLAPAWQYSDLYRAKMPPSSFVTSRWRTQIANLLGRVGDWGRYFEEYQRRSQGLMPTQASLAKRFRTATQR